MIPLLDKFIFSQTLTIHSRGALLRGALLFSGSGDIIKYKVTLLKGIILLLDTTLSYESDKLNEFFIYVIKPYRQKVQYVGFTKEHLAFLINRKIVIPF